MFGPGEYVSDPTEGIVDIKDLPAPQLVPYSRNQKYTPCPRCDHLSSRHTSGQRTLHDLGDVSTGRPVDLLVTYSSHYCSKCQKYFNIDLSDVAPPGGHWGVSIFGTDMCCSAYLFKCARWSKTLPGPPGFRLVWIKGDAFSTRGLHLHGDGLAAL